MQRNEDVPEFTVNHHKHPEAGGMGHAERIFKI